jgi:hypothetical protein
MKHHRPVLISVLLSIVCLSVVAGALARTKHHAVAEAPAGSVPGASAVAPSSAVEIRAAAPLATQAVTTRSRRHEPARKARPSAKRPTAEARPPAAKVPARATAPARSDDGVVGAHDQARPVTARWGLEGSAVSAPAFPTGRSPWFGRTVAKGCW